MDEEWNELKQWFINYGHDTGRYYTKITLDEILTKIQELEDRKNRRRIV